MIRLIGLDLDGTLLNSRKEVSKHTRLVLTEAIHRGIEIVPVTGRPYQGIPKQVLEIPGIRHSISTNGAVIMDCRQQRILRQRTITRTICEEILHQTDGDGVIQEIFVNGFGYESQKHFELLMSHMRGRPLQTYIEQSRIPVTDLYEFLDQSVEAVDGISLMGISSKRRPELLEYLSMIQEVRVVNESDHDFEINAAQADKGLAILELGQMLGIAQEEIMAIGDSNNDMGLMQRAGISVAMGNACAQLKEQADFVTLDHDHDGVAEAIKAVAL